ncbi:MAG: hypothetical protein WBW53_22105, partial [Terriglobales bacterium]
MRKVFPAHGAIARPKGEPLSISMGGVAGLLHSEKMFVFGAGGKLQFEYRVVAKLKTSGRQKNAFRSGCSLAEGQR